MGAPASTCLCCCFCVDVPRYFAARAHQKPSWLWPVQCSMCSFCSAVATSLQDSLCQHALQYTCLRCRWCVTGTPVGTDINDLLGQFAVLQLHPFDNRDFLQFHGSSQCRQGSFHLLLYILRRCMVRHTELQVEASQQPLLLSTQPPCT